MLGYLIHLSALWAIFAIAATVVATLADDAGLIHVGASAIMGVGGYSAALLTTSLGLNPQIALLFAAPIGAVTGLAIHFTVMRMSRDVLSLATLAIGIILYGIMLSAESLTGGPMGLAGIPARTPWTGSDALDALCILILILSALAMYRNSRFVTRVRAMREDEELAGDLELRVPHIKAILWVVSSAILSLAGALLAFHLRYIDPSSFTVRESVGILAMALIIPGPKYVNASIGALTFVALPELFRFVGLPAESGAEVRQLLFGGALLMVVANSKSWVRRSTRSGLADV